jgi:hypothetical protein
VSSSFTETAFTETGQKYFIGSPTRLQNKWKHRLIGHKQFFFKKPVEVFYILLHVLVITDHCQYLQWNITIAIISTLIFVSFLQSTIIVDNTQWCCDKYNVAYTKIRARKCSYMKVGVDIFPFSYRKLKLYFHELTFSLWQDIQRLESVSSIYASPSEVHFFGEISSFLFVLNKNCSIVSQASKCYEERGTDNTTHAALNVLNITGPPSHSFLKAVSCVGKFLQLSSHYAQTFDGESLSYFHFHHGKGYELDDLRIIFRFPEGAVWRMALVCYSFLHKQYRRVTIQFKGQRRETHNSPVYNAKEKNAWRHTSTPPCSPHPVLTLSTKEISKFLYISNSVHCNSISVKS